MNTNTLKVAGGILGLAMGSVVGVQQASAAIIAVAGQTTWLLAPPVSCMPGALLGPNAFTWNEKQNLLVANVQCDMVNNPGNSGGAVPGLVSGIIDSHFIHFEPSTAGLNANGMVKFAGKIRGVIFRQIFLDITDIPLGAPATTYPTGNPLRGLNASSFFQINNNMLQFHFVGQIPPPDLLELRVLTEHVVPAPGSLALIGLGGLVAARRRRV
ncbi:MAG: PEP-CTERM sorting domain-containing protein [Phycisphaerales bacterium]